ncbi:MAG TPA: NAD-dependent epimerase/dehydratase family protein [Bacteroidota bacterium]
MTGGTGFIGSHLVEHLLQQRFEVRCIVRPSRANLGWIDGLPVDVAKVDLADAQALKSAVQDAEYIFHIAGTTKVRRMEEYHTGNVTATQLMLDAATHARRLKKFCHMSSLSVVGPSEDGKPLDENSPYRPISLYGDAKYEAEQLVKSYSKSIPAVILRPPTVYGPRDTDVFEMFQWVKRGIMPRIGKEEKTLSMIHAHDLARGIMEATVSEKSAGQTYFIANEPIYPYSQIIQLLAKIQGVRNARMIPLPDVALYTIAVFTQIGSKFSSRPNILNTNKAKEIVKPHWICSPKKLKDEVGFETKIPIEDGLRSTYEWYKANAWLS